MSTRSTLRAEVREELDDTSSDPDEQTWDDARINRKLERSRQHVAGLIRAIEPERFFAASQDITTVAGQQTYSLNSNFLYAQKVERRVLNGLSLPTPEPIPWVAFQDLDDYLDVASRSVQPHRRLEVYHIRDGTLWLAPAPSQADTAAIRVYYIKRLAAFASDSDESGIPEEIEELVVLHACLSLFSQKPSDPAAIGFLRRFQDVWERVKNDLGTGRHLSSPRFTRQLHD